MASSSPGLPYPPALHPGCPFRIKSFALSARISLDNSFPSVRLSSLLGPWRAALLSTAPTTCETHFIPAENKPKDSKGSEAKRLLSVKDGWAVGGYFPAFLTFSCKNSKACFKSPCRSPIVTGLIMCWVLLYVPSLAPFSEARE